MSSRGIGTRIFIVVVVLAFTVSSLALTGSVIFDIVSNDDEQSSQTTDNLEDQIKQLQEAEGAEVDIEDIEVGKGAEAKKGKKVTVHYVGTLKDGGKKFDSSHDAGQPFTFELGAGKVIPGWEQGLPGMKVGGKRKLTIPAVLAYGDQSPSEEIPPNSDLVFEIELLKVE